jgi:hypothetical protein
VNNIVYNYFKIVNQDGDTIGVCGVEKGSDNEVKIINEIFNLGCKPVIISEQEYTDFDGNELTNF